MAGAPRMATTALKDFLQGLVTDPEVQDAIRDQVLCGGSSSPRWVLGKPKERVEFSSTDMAGLLLAIQHSQRKGDKEWLRLPGSGHRDPLQPQNHAAA